MIQEVVGRHQRGQTLRTHEKPTPAWVDPALLARALSAQRDAAPVAAATASHFEFPEFEVYATERGEHDLVLQFIEVKIPRFEELLAEAIEAHFGTTEGFSLHNDEDVKSYGLLMRGVRGRPGFSYKAFVEDLLTLVLGAHKAMGGGR